MITPIELLGKDLKKGFGYKALMVDEFIEDVAKDYESIYNENAELREKTAALKESLTHYRGMEESLKRALVIAQESSKETLENADNAAKNIEDKARQEAKKILDEANRQAEKIRFDSEEKLKVSQKERMDEIRQLELKIEKLDTDYKSYKVKMRQLLNNHLELLDNTHVEIEKKQEKVTKSK